MNVATIRLDELNFSHLEVNNPKKSNNEPVQVWRIFLVALTANLGALVAGACMSWPSPMGPKLRAHSIDSPLSRPITPEEDGWISSIIAIGALITPFIASPMADIIGRKSVLLSSSLFFASGFIFMLVANEVWLLLVGRLIMGFGIGFVMSVGPTYVSEISNNETRGGTGPLMSFLMTFGLLYVYSIGPFVSYMMLQYACLILPALHFICFIFMPESPFFYIAKSDKAQASKALQFLRGQSAAGVEKELLEIEQMVTSSMEKKGSFADLIKISGNRKALIICIGLIFFQQLSGVNSVIFNNQSIFESAHLNFQAAFASIVIGIIQFLSAMTTPFIGNKFGRRTILIVSSFFMFIGLALLGYFFYDGRRITWLPVPAFALYIINFTIGFGPVPWTVLSEVFPPNVRSLAAAVNASFCWTIGFFVALSYPTLDALGIHYAFWFFAICCFGAFLFCIFVLIETKGLSLFEIQKKLNK